MQATASLASRSQLVTGVSLIRGGRLVFRCNCDDDGATRAAFSRSFTGGARRGLCYYPRVHTHAVTFCRFPLPSTDCLYCTFAVPTRSHVIQSSLGLFTSVRPSPKKKTAKGTRGSMVRCSSSCVKSFFLLLSWCWCVFVSHGGPLC